MCGIAGIVWPGKSAQPFVQLALELQRHRGPEGEGSFVLGHSALVHSRLSILDLQGGQQPMESAAFALVFNGEIYNYSELKRDLESKGMYFKTNSDTEVILLGFEHWGLGLLSKLRGMFALAILDKKSLILLAKFFFPKSVLFFSSN
jgi:asparagine synthase (glutamine-hydrolysing)